jgi:hypothetical protein
MAIFLYRTRMFSPTANFDLESVLVVISHDGTAYHCLSQKHRPRILLLINSSELRDRQSAQARRADYSVWDSGTVYLERAGLEL